MAETLTVDTSPNTEVLTPDEQDSLEVGEALQAQQENLLAGKYKDARELEKAYIELQSEFSRNKNEAPTDQPTQQKVEEEGADVGFLDRLWDEATTNSYKDETLKELSNMSTRDLAQMHLQFRSEVQENQPQVVNEDQVSQLKDICGGDQGYSSMVGWAKETLQDQEIQMYDAVMERGDPLGCFFAVQALKYRYDDAAGFDGQMLTGKAPSTVGDQFNSQAQVVEAMSDPKYENDPAYRQEIMLKLERSNIQF
tara:strand:+ start:829 stop:1587 length:759 start_codon:yes stop_codon:yes gene_type:complete